MPSADPAGDRAREFFARRIAGKELKGAVAKVCKSLDWKKRLDDAVAAAKDDDKPILWIKALGDIDGFA